MIDGLRETSRALYPSTHSKRCAAAADHISKLHDALSKYDALRSAAPETVNESLALCLGQQVAWDRVKDLLANVEPNQ